MNPEPPDDYWIQRRVPREGDRVRFWVVAPEGHRQQVEGTVLRSDADGIELRCDGDPRRITTRAREMEILDD